MKRLIPLLIFVSLVSSCHKRTPTTALPPPAMLPTSAPLPAPPPSLDQADAAFTTGNYFEAARRYESYLQEQGSTDKRDQALFRLALTYVLPAVPDWAHASILFKQLVDEYPQSPLKPAASIILALHTELTAFNTDSQKRDQRIKQLTAELLTLQAEFAALNTDSQKRDQRIKQLTTELDKLKQIDAERRKKP